MVKGLNPHKPFTEFQPSPRIGRYQPFCFRMQSSSSPNYADDILQDLPELSHILNQGDFLVYSRNYKGKHEVKSADKMVLCVGKWKKESSTFSRGPTISNLIVKTPDKNELLTMKRAIGGHFSTKTKVFEMTALPHTYLGKINRDEQHHYQVLDSTGQVVLLVQKITRVLSRSHYKILSRTEEEIGTIGDNKGSKHVLQIPASLPLSHKALLLGFTLGIQDAYDAAQQAQQTAAVSNITTTIS